MNTATGLADSTTRAYFTAGATWNDVPALTAKARRVAERNLATAKRIGEEGQYAEMVAQTMAGDKMDAETVACRVGRQRARDAGMHFLVP